MQIKVVTGDTIKLIIIILTCCPGYTTITTYTHIIKHKTIYHCFTIYRIKMHLYLKFHTIKMHLYLKFYTVSYECTKCIAKSRMLMDEFIYKLIFDPLYIFFDLTNSFFFKFKNWYKECKKLTCEHFHYHL